MQLVGHLKGHTLAEWNLLGRDKVKFLVKCLKECLDHCSGQDLRTTVQGDIESVADFVCHLEKSYHVAFSRPVSCNCFRYHSCKSVLLYLQNRKITVHQSRIKYCPAAFPAGFYWYNSKQKGLGNVPQWVQNLLSDATSPYIAQRQQYLTMMSHPQEIQLLKRQVSL